MEMKLYLVTDSNNVIGKTLNQPMNIDIVLRKDFDIKNPVIIIKVENDDIDDVNYVYMPTLDRYYFIEDKTMIANRVYRLTLATDLLETYKKDILASVARFTRSVKHGDFIIANVDMLETKTIDRYTSDKGFSGEKSMVMATAGD